MDKEVEKIIKELEYAKKLHDLSAQDLSLEKKWRDRDKRISKNKTIIIKALKGEIPVSKGHVRIVKYWRSLHQKGVEYLGYWKKHKSSKAKAKELEEDIRIGGSLNWHKRWVRTYDQIITALEQKLKI